MSKPESTELSESQERKKPIKPSYGTLRRTPVARIPAPPPSVDTPSDVVVAQSLNPVIPTKSVPESEAKSPPPPADTAEKLTELQLANRDGKSELVVRLVKEHKEKLQEIHKQAFGDEEEYWAWFEATISADLDKSDPNIKMDVLTFFRDAVVCNKEFSVFKQTLESYIKIKLGEGKPIFITKDAAITEDTIKKLENLYNRSLSNFQRLTLEKKDFLKEYKSWIAYATAHVDIAALRLMVIDKDTQRLFPEYVKKSGEYIALAKLFKLYVGGRQDKEISPESRAIRIIAGPVFSIAEKVMAINDLIKDREKVDMIIRKDFHNIEIPSEYKFYHSIDYLVDKAIGDSETNSIIENILKTSDSKKGEESIKLINKILEALELIRTECQRQNLNLAFVYSDDNKGAMNDLLEIAIDLSKVEPMIVTDAVITKVKDIAVENPVLELEIQIAYKEFSLEKNYLKQDNYLKKILTLIYADASESDVGRIAYAASSDIDSAETDGELIKKRIEEVFHKLIERIANNASFIFMCETNGDHNLEKYIKRIDTFTAIAKDMVNKYQLLVNEENKDKEFAIKESLINKKNKDKLLAIHTLLDTANVDQRVNLLIKYFIELPFVDVDIISGSNLTSVHYAIMNFNNDVLQALIKRGAKLDIDGTHGQQIPGSKILKALGFARLGYNKGYGLKINYEAMGIILAAPQQEINDEYIEAAGEWLTNYHIENINEVSDKEIFDNIHKKISDYQKLPAQRLTKLDKLVKDFQIHKNDKNTIKIAAETHLKLSYGAAWVFDFLKNNDLTEKNCVAGFIQNINSDILSDNKFRTLKIKDLWKIGDEESISSRIQQIKLLIEQFRNIKFLFETSCKSKNQSEDYQKEFVVLLSSVITKFSEEQNKLLEKCGAKLPKELPVSLAPSPSVLGDFLKDKGLPGGGRESKSESSFAASTRNLLGIGRKPTLDNDGSVKNKSRTSLTTATTTSMKPLPAKNTDSPTVTTSFPPSNLATPRTSLPTSGASAKPLAPEKTNEQVK